MILSALEACLNNQPAVNYFISHLQWKVVLYIILITVGHEKLEAIHLIITILLFYAVINIIMCSIFMLHIHQIFMLLSLIYSTGCIVWL